jgi:hypothetical protein
MKMNKSAASWEQLYRSTGQKKKIKKIKKKKSHDFLEWRSRRTCIFLALHLAKGPNK